MMLASTIVPVRSRWPRDARCALISSNRPSPRPCFSNRCRKFRMVVSSGSASVNRSPETPHRLHLVELVGPPSPGRSGCRTTARSEPQHLRQRVRAPTAPRLRIERLDPSLQPLPGNQLVHLLKEQLTPRPALLQVGSSSHEACLCHGSIDQCDSCEIMAHGRIMTGQRAPLTETAVVTAPESAGRRIPILSAGGGYLPVSYGELGSDRPFAASADVTRLATPSPPQAACAEPKRSCAGDRTRFVIQRIVRGSSPPPCRR